MAKSVWKKHPSEALRVAAGFSLASVDPDSTPGFDGDKDDRERAMRDGANRLSELQERFFAGSRAGVSTDALLLVVQGMDTAGKGGIVRHVVGAVDPQGVSIASFKAPTKQELRHDFLWRVEKKLPEHGQIGVFDRSHYEDVLIARVRELAPAEEIERRYGAINSFERRELETGTRMIKVMLHISPDEQKARLQERLDRPDKHWKYNRGDVDERLLWDDYMTAYQIMLERTSTDIAPWHVIPANSKWFARLAVQELLIATLEAIDPQWPAAQFDIEVEKARLAAS